MLGCRSSGLIVSDALVFSGRVKLVSVHATNFHTSQDALIIIYDNTAFSANKHQFSYQEATIPFYHS